MLPVSWSMTLKGHRASPNHAQYLKQPSGSRFSVATLNETKKSPCAQHARRLYCIILY
jgi:hypothetical protein